MVGRPRREHAWFGSAARMPLLTMSADRAARRVVRAAVRGRRQVTLGPVAKLVVSAHGIAPGATMRLSRLINWLLPSAGVDEAGTRAEARAAKGAGRPLGAYSDEETATPRATGPVLDWLRARLG